MVISGGKYWVCKSDMTVTNMQKWGIIPVLTREELKKCFDYCVEMGYARVAVTGSKTDKRRQRHTIFVELEKFKMAVKWFFKHF